MSIIVRADWDDEAQVWVATSHDVDGLAVESDTLEALKDKVVAAITDLLELNGFAGDGGLPEIPVHIMSEQMARVPNPRF
ncbi:DUF1902 domain-containing protein [Psychromarinibacter sp. C21-152]|uniref:DUF1902 domain-containing protein n=1 Tax=Psychromarinibacter sediminicola TaxID=3033385 RepID=A0AAE3NR18_9RHOB|nr:DUF1902 domain-containing protein [Psychromarinibacter sediminicola]MDF0600089.1 DUF1902 domain-containing protein [Psychromarinibacter sediminicola]